MHAESESAVDSISKMVTSTTDALDKPKEKKHHKKHHKAVPTKADVSKSAEEPATAAVAAVTEVKKAVVAEEKAVAKIEEQAPVSTAAVHTKALPETTQSQKDADA